MKKILNKFFNKKKGVSILETAIALTVITIISASVITLIIASVKTENKNYNSLYISSYAESSVECFRFADSSDELFELLKKTDAEYARTDNVFTLDKGQYILTVTVDFESGVLDLLANDPDGKELYALSYRKE